MKRKVIFLDRDGTLIVDRIYLNDPNQIEYLPGVFEALIRLRDFGFEFVVLTNQSGIARHLVEPKNLYETHRRMRFAFAERGISFLDFQYAPYMTNSNHPLRKPEPGMILEAAKTFRVDLGLSWMMGDRMSDVEAGHRAGTKSALIGLTESPSDFSWAPPEIHDETLLKISHRILS